MFSNFVVELGTTNSGEKFTIKTHEPRLRNLEQRLPVSHQAPAPALIDLQLCTLFDMAGWQWSFFQTKILYYKTPPITNVCFFLPNNVKSSS